MVRQSKQIIEGGLYERLFGCLSCQLFLIHRRKSNECSTDLSIVGVTGRWNTYTTSYNFIHLWRYQPLKTWSGYIQLQTSFMFPLGVRALIFSELERFMPRGVRRPISSNMKSKFRPILKVSSLHLSHLM